MRGERTVLAEAMASANLLEDPARTFTDEQVCFLAGVVQALKWVTALDGTKRPMELFYDLQDASAPKGVAVPPDMPPGRLREAGNGPGTR